MTVDNLITFVRDQSQASTSNIDATTILRYVNIGYHKLENAITDRVDEDCFWDIFTADTLADQNEYSLQATDATTEGIKKINRVEIKRESTDDYLTLLRNDGIANFDKADGYLQDYVPLNKGFWEHRDNSIFVYPAPDNSVTNWLKIHANIALKDLVAGGAETTIFPNKSVLRQYHYVVGLATIPHVLRHKNVEDQNLIVSAENNYRAELETMIDELNALNTEPQEVVLPNAEKRY